MRFQVFAGGGGLEPIPRRYRGSTVFVLLSERDLCPSVFLRVLIARVGGLLCALEPTHHGSGTTLHSITLGRLVIYLFRNHQMPREKDL